MKITTTRRNGFQTETQTYDFGPWIASFLLWLTVRLFVETPPNLWFFLAGVAIPWVATRLFGAWLKRRYRHASTSGIVVLLVATLVVSLSTRFVLIHNYTEYRGWEMVALVWLWIAATSSFTTSDND